MHMGFAIGIQQCLFCLHAILLHDYWSFVIFQYTYLIILCLMYAMFVYCLYDWKFVHKSG